MNLQTKLMISALGLCALPLAQAQERYVQRDRDQAPERAQFQDCGRVVRVEPRAEQIRVPRQECRTDYQQVPVQQQRSAGGAVIGGIAGALLGNQVVGYAPRGDARDPLPIELGLDQSQRTWSAALAATPVAIAHSAAGPQLLQLGELVDAKIEPGGQTIFRRDGRGATTPDPGLPISPPRRR